jgi:hypothetical protein
VGVHVWRSVYVPSSFWEMSAPEPDLHLVKMDLDRKTYKIWLRPSRSVLEILHVIAHHEESTHDRQAANIRLDVGFAVKPRYVVQFAVGHFGNIGQ